MKIEKRGKYPGVKVHLEPDECEAFITLAGDMKASWGKDGIPSPVDDYFGISVRIGKKLTKLIQDEPGLLTERTEDEILASMEKDLSKITQQKAAIAAKKDWKAVI